MKNKLYAILLIMLIISTSCAKSNLSDKTDNNSTKLNNEDYEKYCELYNHLKENLKISGYNLIRPSEIGSVFTYIPEKVTFNNKQLLSLDDDDRKATYMDLVYESVDAKSLITINLSYMGKEDLYNTLNFFSTEGRDKRISFYTLLRYENSILSIVKEDYSDAEVTEEQVLNAQPIYEEEVKGIVDFLKEYKDMKPKDKTN